MNKESIFQTMILSLAIFCGASVAINTISGETFDMFINMFAVFFFSYLYLHIRDEDKK